jgi:hypothetical protein
MSGPATCTFTGSFTFAGQPEQVSHATLSKDKQTALGVGRFPGGTFVFGLVKL